MGSPPLSLAEAELIGMVLHTLLYGIYVVLSIGSIYLPMQRKDSPPHRGLQAVTVILFVLITAHWIVQILRMFDAFIHNLGGKGGPSAYYGYAANPKMMAKTALYVTQTWVGDLTMTYRLYVVWNRNKYVAIFPAILSCVLLACGSVVVYEFSQLKLGEDIFKASAGRWIMCVFALTLATNCIVTLLIAYRVLTVHYRLPKDVKVIGRSLWFIMEIVLESAGIYTLILVITMSGYISKELYQFTTLDATSPVIGIAFTLIIVRVGLGISTGHPDGNTAVKTIGSGRSNQRPISNTVVNPSFQMKDSLKVIVESQVVSHVDSDSAYGDGDLDELRHHDGYANQSTEEMDVEMEKGQAL